MLLDVLAPKGLPELNEERRPGALPNGEGVPPLLLFFCWLSTGLYGDPPKTLPMTGLPRPDKGELL